MKAVRFLFGLVLIPVGVALTMTAMTLIGLAQEDGAALAPPPVLAIGGGYLLWLLLYFTLPRPVRAYILAHELTHALWGAVMGARVSRLRVGRDHGSVTLSKTNFWITLAPYFFPLYTVMVVVAYGVLGQFMDVSRYYLLWLGLVGFTWSFHLTFTVAALGQSQSDVRAYGYIFSYALIYALNLLGICLWIVGVSRVTRLEAGETLLFHGQCVFAWCRETIRTLWITFRH